MENFTPMIGKILVKLDEELEVKKNGVIIPNLLNGVFPKKAKVIKLSKGKYNKNGTIIPFEVKEGDKVLVSVYGGVQFNPDDERSLLIEEDDILAILED